MKAPAGRDDAPLRDLDDREVTRFLLLGLTESARPVDELIDRLDGPRGGEWLRSGLDAAFGRVAGELERLLAGGEAALEELVRIKEEAKRLTGGGGGGEESHRYDREREREREMDLRLLGMAGYFFAVAAARVHRGEVICGRPLARLLPAVEDLGAVAPPPWGGLLRALLDRERASGTG